MTAEVVTSVEAAAYTIPTERPEADGTIAWSSTTLVLVRVSGAGATGIGWTYDAPAAARVVRDQLADVVCGTPVDDVPRANEAMRRALRNAGLPGIGATAVSAVDIALWDLKGKVHGAPVAGLLGRCHDAVPVYGSGGFTTFDDDTLRKQLTAWVDNGIPRVKIKIGESWGSDVARDVERMRVARAAIGGDTELYVDANGAYTRKQAIRLLHEVTDLDVRWFEEPVSSDDLDGLAIVRDAVQADVAAGEYANDVTTLLRLAGSVDVLQADVTRIGGITVWQRAAAVASATQLQVSGHCAPHAHLAVAASVPNLRHLEWFSDHVRIESMLFDGAEGADGGAVAVDRREPGLGYVFRDSDAERFRVA